MFTSKSIAEALYGGNKKISYEQSPLEQALTDVLEKNGKPSDLGKYMSMLSLIIPNVREQMAEPKELFEFVRNVEKRYYEIIGINTQTRPESGNCRSDGNG